MQVRLRHVASRGALAKPDEDGALTLTLTLTMALTGRARARERPRFASVRSAAARFTPQRLVSYL
jgi:hypothetical protein